jgi:hypothetical protein
MLFNVPQDPALLAVPEFIKSNPNTMNKLIKSIKIFCACLKLTIPTAFIASAIKITLCIAFYQLNFNSTEKAVPYKKIIDSSFFFK